MSSRQNIENFQNELANSNFDEMESSLVLPALGGKARSTMPAIALSSVVDLGNREPLITSQDRKNTTTLSKHKSVSIQQMKEQGIRRKKFNNQRGSVNPLGRQMSRMVFRGIQDHWAPVQIVSRRGESSPGLQPPGDSGDARQGLQRDNQPARDEDGVL